jgi:hypothetical protein
MQPRISWHQFARQPMHGDERGHKFHWSFFAGMHRSVTDQGAPDHQKPKPDLNRPRLGCWSCHFNRQLSRLAGGTLVDAGARAGFWAQSVRLDWTGRAASNDLSAAGHYKSCIVMGGRVGSMQTELLY